MIRIAGFLLIAACCSLTGLALSARLSGRVRELERAISLTGMLASDLKFTMAPMETVVARAAADGSLPFLARCAQLCGGGTAFPEAWADALEHTPTSLLPEDREVLGHLGRVLGAVELDGALSELDYAAFLLRQRHEEAKARRDQMGGLYKTLGVLAGIGIVVVLF